MEESDYQDRGPSNQSTPDFLGPHHEWRDGGHETLASIDFPVWGLRDTWSGKWLGLWVLPESRGSDRLNVIMCYLILSLVDQLGGLPLQITGHFSKNKPMQVDDLASLIWRFSKSINNRTLDRPLKMRLHMKWAEAIEDTWSEGFFYGYDSRNSEQHELFRWLWSTLIQKELDELRDLLNSHRVRKQRNKKTPSGVSPNLALGLPGEYGGENCLQPVDTDLVRQLMEDLGGEDLTRFVSAEFAERAEKVLVDSWGGLGMITRKISGLSSKL